MSLNKPIEQKYNRDTILLTAVICVMYLYENIIIYVEGSYRFYNYYLRSLMWIIIGLYMIKFVPRVWAPVKKRYKTEFKFWALICGIIYIFAYMIAGVAGEFGKNPYSFDTIDSIIRMIVDLIKIIGRESIRFFLLNRTFKRYGKKARFLVLMLMTITELPFAQVIKITGLQSSVIFLVQILSPAIVKNILLNFISTHSNIISCVIYSGLSTLFLIALPVIPELQWLIMGMVGTLIPLFSYMAISTFYDQMLPSYKKYREKPKNIFSWIVVSVASISMIWFSVGVFDIFPTVIVTGSMEPLIFPGDMVLISKISDPREVREIMVGDVIQFQREDGLPVLHRVVEIVNQEGVVAYRTKGDNNSKNDEELVQGENIRGRLYKVIPKIGIPTMIFRGDDSVDLSDLVF